MCHVVFGRLRFAHRTYLSHAFTWTITYCFKWCLPLLLDLFSMVFAVDLLHALRYNLPRRHWAVLCSEWHIAWSCCMRQKIKRWVGNSTAWLFASCGRIQFLLWPVDSESWLTAFIPSIEQGVLLYAALFPTGVKVNQKVVLPEVWGPRPCN